MKKVLIVAAHPDDEILGAGGTLLKHRRAGDRLSILFLGDGVTSRDPRASTKERSQQAKLVARALGAQQVYMHQLPDNQFDTLPLLDLSKKVEAVVSKVKPEVIYTNYINDLNIDHRLTCQAVLTACRPQPGSTVKKILSWETLSSTEWQAKDPARLFCPTVYSDITKFIDKKIALLRIYKHELRSYPHPRSIEGVKVLAKYRGLEVGLRYAEAFHLIRSIE